MFKKKKIYLIILVFAVLFIFRNSILVFIVNRAGSYLINSEVKVDKAKLLTDPFRLKLENAVVMNPKKYNRETTVIKAADFLVELKPTSNFSGLYIPHAYGNQISIFLTIKDGENNLKYILENIKTPFDLYLDSLEATNITLNIDLNNTNDKKPLSLDVSRFDIGTEKPGEMPFKKDSLYNSLLLEGLFEIPENLLEQL